MRTLLVALMVCAVLPAAAQTEPPEHVRMTLERFEKLMASARPGEGPAVTWGRGDIRVQLPGPDGQFATVDLTASARAIGDGVVQLVLLPGDVVIESASVGGSDATLARRAGAHIALLPNGTREIDIRLRYLVPVTTPGGAGRTALIPLPPLSGSTMRVVGTRDPKAIEIWPGGRIQTSGNDLVATLPSTIAAAVRFGEGLEGHRIRRVDYDLRVDDTGDGVDIVTTWDIHMTAPRATVRLAPESMPLVDVRRQGEGVVVTRIEDGWHTAIVEGEGRHTLEATFRMAVDRSQGQPQVRLQLDRVPITHLSARIPGKREVTLEPAVPLTTTFEGEEKAATTLAKGYLPPSSMAVIRWTETRPSPEKLVRINTETWQLVEIQEGVLRSTVHIDYQILRGKTKELPIQIPEGVVLYRVSGENIEDWRTFAATDDEPRHVRVYLGREREGSYRLTLELETVIPKTEGTEIEVPVVRPMSAFRETGVVALFDGKKVGFAKTTQSGFTKVGQDALPSYVQAALDKTVNEAFKHIGAPGSVKSTVAEVQAKEVLFDARTVALYSVKEGAILANATVQVEVKSGRRDDLVLSFPSDVTILAVTAPSVSRKGILKDFDAGEGRQAYELKFSQALEGIIEVHLEFELVLKNAVGPIGLPDVRVHGAEVEEGSFGITAETGIEVTPAAGQQTELRRVDVTELPESVRRRAVGGSEILLGYQYAHTPWSLDLEVKRHKTVETLTAAVNAAWLETTVYEDGHVVTRAVFQVKNEDRQFLRVKLPEGSKVWTVAAGGSPIKAVNDESGAVAIPLRKRQLTMVEVVYEVSQTEALGSFGSLAMVAPELDALITDLQWLIRVPQKLTLYNVDTSLEPVDADNWRPADTSGSELPVALPPAEDMTAYLFRLAVIDPAEDAPGIQFSYATRPGDGLGTTAFVLGLLLLLIVVWRRASRRRTGVLGMLLGVVGLGLIVARAVVWGVSGLEATIAAVLLALTAFVGWVLGGRSTDEEEA